jgi:DNA-binding transcriptional LysR family regulator
VPDHGDWAALELRHLLALLAVVEEGSFQGAARRLGYSQPGISHQIAALERIVGSELVVRRGCERRVTPTAAGRALLPRAAEIVEAGRKARRELGQLGGAGDARDATGTLADP